MAYVNVHKKKEFEKKGDLGLLFVLKKLVDSRYATDTASKLNEIMKEYGPEKTKTVFYKALKKNPNLPKPYFYVREGQFVGYSTNSGEESFISVDTFFKNPDKYIEKHKEIKREESRKFEKFEKHIKMVSDMNYRYEELDRYVNLENISLFFKYLHKNGKGKVMEDNPYISPIQNVGKKYFVTKGFFDASLHTLVKNALDGEEETGLFPVSFGYSYIGKEGVKRLFLVNNVYEIKRFAEKEGKDKTFEKLEEFFSENKFILLNDIRHNALIYSKEKGNRIYIETLINDPLTEKFLKGVREIENIMEISGIVENTEKYMENLTKGTRQIKNKLREILKKKTPKYKDLGTP